MKLGKWPIFVDFVMSTQTCHLVVILLLLLLLLFCVVSPLEATELPGNSEELEAGVVQQKPPQDNTKTSDDRQHVELTQPLPGLNFDPVF